MKRTLFILAMLLIAATSYNQTSRKPANTETSARRSTSEARTNSQSSRSATTNTQVRSRSSQPESSRTSRSTVAKTRTENHTNDRTYARSSSTQSQSPARTTNSYTRTTTTRTSQPANSRSGNSTQNTANRTRTVDRTSYHTNNTRPVQKHSSVRHAHASQRVYTERHAPRYHYQSKPANRYYRAKHYAYRAPSTIHVVWTPTMYRHYTRMYPSVKYWSYSNGHRIHMVSSYFAEYYTGDVMTVYGRVQEVFYSRATDEYFLYFGLYYPHQDFTMIIPGYIARRYSQRPDRFFLNRHLASTGLITNFQGEPEMVVRESFQLHLY